MKKKIIIYVAFIVLSYAAVTGWLFDLEDATTKREAQKELAVKTQQLESAIETMQKQTATIQLQTATINKQIATMLHANGAMHEAINAMKLQGDLIDKLQGKKQ